MSHFDPKIYCKQNLKEKDLRELNFWYDTFMNIISNVEDDYTDSALSIVKEIVHDFCDELKEHIGFSMQEIVASIIEGYEESVVAQDDPDTYLYDRYAEEE